MGAEINLAGLLTVTGDDGGRWHLESAQAQVAFARLVLERDRGTTRDQLADVVWPDQLPRTWASALRSVVSRVRGFVLAALPSIDQPLVAQGGRYLLRLPPDAVVDVEAAERAVIAAQDALVAGDFETARRLSCEGADRLRAPFLPDHDGTWVSSWRDHLAELLVTSLETASHAAAALGDCTRALVLADEATTRAPLRESAHRCRMAAHAAAGNRGEALRAYQRLRRLLADELGVDPAPDTEAAYLELLGTSPAPMPPMRAGVRPDGVVPFVGREAEMGVVNEAWSETLVGRRQLLYVSGEAGVGKTRLVKEAGARIAADGGLVLFGRCDRESLIPYQPFVEAFDAYVAATPLEELFALTRASRSELAAVFPSVYPPRRFERPADRTKLFDAIAELTVDTTRERPMLLLFDNLQWADRDTLWLLRHLLRQPNEARLLVMATARDDVIVASAAPEVIHGLERDGFVTRLALSGFDRAIVEALAEQLLPAHDGDRAGLVEQLLADTAGNPFMIVEVLRHRDTVEAWVEDQPLPVPRSVQDAVAAKLRTVQNPDVERLLLAAAVAGPTFEIDVAAKAAGLDFSAALDALDLALSTGLLVEAEPGRGFAEYRFRHELARRGLKSQLSGARHHHLKARVVQAK